VKLLDTTVAIDHLRGDQAAVDLLRALIENDETVAASEVVRFELLAGVRDDELPALEQFFSAVSWVAVGEEVARTAGGLARKHRRAHSGIDDADYLIAATAILLEADVLTTNVRHFPMLPGLQPPY
jgi:predicted nucleic acid-binding protein